MLGIHFSCVIFAQSPLPDSLSDGIALRANSQFLTPVWYVADSNFNQGLIHDPWELIRGQIPGLLISRVGSDPNQAPDVRLRGITFLSSAGSPLVVVDGIPHVPLQAVNPHDIAELTFLSGAQALALYGTQAAGGVLVVNTHRPEAGQSFQFDYQSQVAIEQISRYWGTFNRVEYLALPGVPDYGSNTDWQREITRQGIGQTHSMSMTGTLPSDIRVRGGVNYRSAQGVLVGQDFEQWSGNLDLHKAFLGDRLRISAKVQRWRRQADLGRPEAVRSAIAFNPTIPVRSEDPNFSDDLGYFHTGQFGIFNPLWMVNESFVQTIVDQTHWQARGEFEWLPNLVTEATYSQQWLSGEAASLYLQPIPGTGLLGDAYLTDYKDQSRFWQVLTRYQYLGEQIQLQAEGGFQRRINLLDQEYFGTPVGSVDQPVPANLEQLSDNRAIYLPPQVDPLSVEQLSTSRDWRYSGAFIRLDAQVSKNFFLSGSLRRDVFEHDSSRWFPGISAAIDMNQWIDSSDTWLRIARIRGSWGLASGFTRSIPRLQPFFTPYFMSSNLPFVTSLNPPDRTSGRAPDLVRLLDIGLDLGGENWFASLNIYRRFTQNPWLDVFTFLPGSSTDREPWVIPNLSIRNQGIEAQIGGILSKGKFQYQASLNFATYQNQIFYQEVEDAVFIVAEDFEDRPLSSTPGTPGSQPISRLSAQGQVGELYGPQLNEDATRESGELVFFDRNVSPTLVDTTLGQGLPRWSLGLHQQWRLGGWQLSALLRGDMGHDLGNVTRLVHEPTGGSSWRNRVQTEAFEPLTNGVPTWHDYYLENASYLSLDYVRLSYELFSAQKWDLTLSLTGQNLWVWTNYSGLDAVPRFKDQGDIAYGQGNRVGIPHNYTSLGIDRQQDGYATRSTVFGVEFSW